MFAFVQKLSRVILEIEVWIKHETGSPFDEIIRT